MATGRLLGPLAVATGWCIWVWLSGRAWSHQPRARVVTRPVRAVGNWAATAVVVGLLWRPVATAVVLATTGVGLVATATTLRRRDRLTGPGRPPIRVTAATGPTQRLTEGS